MNAGQYVFSQLLGFLPRHEFDRCVERYKGNYRVQSFSCWDQFLCMAFAQLTSRESLRDIEICLRSHQSSLYHLGFRGTISRSTLADANELRDYRIYADFAKVLIDRAKRLYAGDSSGIDLDGAVYAFDSTTIKLCLSLFPWAHFRTTKGAIKMHTLLDLHGNIPSFIKISTGNVHDVNMLDYLPVEAGSYYLVDRAYVDFVRLYRLHQQLAYFVTRAKSNMLYSRRESRPVDHSTGLRSDQSIRLTGLLTSRAYPILLRRVTFRDTEKERSLEFLSNNFHVPALTIPDLYRCRWRVELFFKWVKQNLCFKRFYGNSMNAVQSQIWIAVCIYVLIMILRKELQLNLSPTEIHRVLSLALFDKDPIENVLIIPFHQEENNLIFNQLELFN